MRSWNRLASLNRIIFLLFLAVCLVTSNSFPWDTQAARAAACPPEGCKVFLPSIIKTVDQIQNGDFESGPTAWKEDTVSGYPIIWSQSVLQVPPHSGSWAAWLGGIDEETASIDQDIYVSAARPYLHFWQWIVSDEVICTNDKAWVEINSLILWQENLCLDTNTDAWVQYSLDLAAYIGQTINLKFWASTDAMIGTTSSLYLDDISLQGSP